MFNVSKHSTHEYVTIVTIPRKNIRKIDFALCKQPTETIDSYYNRQEDKPDIVTNGGFFAMNNGNTCFGFMDEGVIKQVSSFWGVGIKGDKDLDFISPDVCNKYRDFIAGYPTLVAEAEKTKPTYAKEIDYRARRTAIGWDKDKFFIVCVDNPGFKLGELADIFMELQVDYAINLDGGGSTRMLINGKAEVKANYNRPVDNTMCVYLNRPLYRVQVGAFKQEKNAQDLLGVLKRTGFTDAYIRNVDGFFKVQVGAFAVELNAERLMDKLRAYGHRAFVTTS